MIDLRQEGDVGHVGRLGQDWTLGGLSGELHSHKSSERLSCTLFPRKHLTCLCRFPFPHVASHWPHSDVCHRGQSVLSQLSLVAGFSVLLHSLSGKTTRSPDDVTSAQSTLLSLLISPQQSPWHYMQEWIIILLNTAWLIATTLIGITR